MGCIETKVNSNEGTYVLSNLFKKRESMNLEQHKILQELYTELENTEIICHECIVILREQTMAMFFNTVFDLSIPLHTQCMIQLFTRLGKSSVILGDRLGY